MDFRLTKEEALFQKMCREFALNEVEPIAAEIDAEERYPEETVQKLMKYGLMGIQFPKEVGGSGGNYICYSIAIEEMQPRMRYHRRHHVRSRHPRRMADLRIRYS